MDRPRHLWTGLGTHGQGLHTDEPYGLFCCAVRPFPQPNSRSCQRTCSQAPRRPSSLAFSESGTHLIEADKFGDVYRYNLASAEEPEPLLGQTSLITDVVRPVALHARLRDLPVDIPSPLRRLRLRLCTPSVDGGRRPLHHHRRPRRKDPREHVPARIHHPQLLPRPHPVRASADLGPEAVATRTLTTRRWPLPPSFEGLQRCDQAAQAVSGAGPARLGRRRRPRAPLGLRGRQVPPSL